MLIFLVDLSWRFQWFEFWRANRLMTFLRKMTLPVGWKSLLTFGRQSAPEPWKRREQVDLLSVDLVLVGTPPQRLDEDVRLCKKSNYKSASGVIHWQRTLS